MSEGTERWPERPGAGARARAAGSGEHGPERPGAEIDERHRRHPAPRRRRGGRARLRRHRADRDPGGDGAVLPGLRHVRHHVPRPAGRARRPQARAPADHLGHGAAGLPARPPLRQVRPRHRRHDGQVPSARQQRDLRRPRAHGPALLAAPPAHRLPRQLRLARLRPGGRALHGVPPAPAGHADGRGHRREHRRPPADLRRVQPRSPSSCPPASPTCWSTAARASPSAWPPTSRPTTWARSSTPPST